MAKIQLCNVVVLNNPCPFLTPFRFELTFECIEELKEDLEWKMIYVGSAESEKYDQVLDRVYVGPIPEGKHMFVFEADSPDVSKIPVNDAIGVTVVLLVGTYRDQEFVRVGYFINNEYTDPEMKENPPTVPQFSQVQRNILATRPRVTRFKINWDDSQSETYSKAYAPLEDVIASNSEEEEDIERGMAAAAEAKAQHCMQEDISLPPTFFSENSQSNNAMEVA